MAMFDKFIFVDWSANSTPNTGKDSIWIAEASGGSSISVSNPSTRDEATQSVLRSLHQAVVAQQRVLVGFDSAYSYPRAPFSVTLIRDRFAGVLRTIFTCDDPAGQVTRVGPSPTYGCRATLAAPGWVPEMNASWTAPGVSEGNTAPFALFTARKTMLPGAANSGGSSLSGRPSM